MKNITWTKIEPGQIVSFVYAAKGKRAVKRTVLCINPNILYKKKDGGSTRFFVGVQLNQRIIYSPLRCCSNPTIVYD